MQHKALDDDDNGDDNGDTNDDDVFLLCYKLWSLPALAGGDAFLGLLVRRREGGSGRPRCARQESQTTPENEGESAQTQGPHDRNSTKVNLSQSPK